MPDVLGYAARCNQDIASGERPGSVREIDLDADALARDAGNRMDFRRKQDLYAFALHRLEEQFADILIFTRGYSRPPVSRIVTALPNRRNACASFQAPDIAGANDNEVVRQTIKLQRLDMSEGGGGSQAGDVRDCRMGAKVEE